MAVVDAPAMKRSPLVRKTPLRSRREGPALDKGEHPRAKEPKAKVCKHCRNDFTPDPRHPMVSHCSPRCGLALFKAKEKADKQAQREREDRDKGIPYWLKKAQEAVNWYCRARDIYAGKGCISCGARPAQKRGGTMDAGHYRSVGSASHLRFFTPQIRLQCVHCNRDLAGNAIEYRKGLVAERGAQWVDHLDSLWWVAKWDVDYLIRLTQIANKKARRMEKGIGPSRSR